MTTPHAHVVPGGGSLRGGMDIGKSEVQAVRLAR